MKTTVTHDNFDSELSAVKSGISKFYIPTHTRCTVIDSKTIGRFDKAGLSVIKKDTDGKGFRLASGKKTLYVLPGQLITA